MMFITSGEFKRRRILTPKGQRPSEGKVRGVLYNVMKERVRGLRVLDLFGGAGALGFEALSWGADFCCFVDNNRGSFAVIKQNIDSLDVAGKTRLVFSDALRYLNKIKDQEAEFDLIFLDPPYNKELVQKSLHALNTYDILSRTGFIVILMSAEDNIDLQAYEKYNVVFDRRYGLPRVIILERSE